MNMGKFPFLHAFPFVLIISACGNRAERLIRSGRYEEAIRYIAERARHQKTTRKDLDLFQYAWNRLQQHDYHILQSASTSRQPQVLRQAMHAGQQILSRQKWILLYLPLEAHDNSGKKLTREHLQWYNDIRIRQQIQKIRDRLARILYDQIRSLLAQEHPEEARRAETYLQELESLNHPDYPPSLIARLRQRIQELGTEHIRVIIQCAIPSEYQDLCRSILEQDTPYWTQLNSAFAWIRFWPGNYPSSGVSGLRNRRYEIRIRIHQIRISPEILDREIQHYKERKIVDYEIQVIHGDTVEIPVYEQFRATAVHIIQRKTVTIRGTFQLRNHIQNTLIAQEPFEALVLFEVEGYLIEGTHEIVPEEIRKKEIPGPAPYPPDEEMIAQGFQRVKEMFRKFLETHHRKLLSS